MLSRIVTKRNRREKSSLDHNRLALDSALIEIGKQGYRRKRYQGRVRKQ